MPLRVTNCSVSNNSITITFSDPVDTNGTAPDNYTIFDPGSVDFSQPQTLADVSGVATLSLDPSSRFLAISFKPSISTVTSEFQNGDWVHITVMGVTASGGAETLGGQTSFARQVPGAPDTRRATRDVEDAISYPILTEEIGYRPSPVGSPTGGGGAGSIPTAGGGANLGQVAVRAVGDVLGWKPNADDPKGFIGALTQSFTLTDVEGHVESKWMPRTYAVQTDLGGGVTGAQASLYTRAKDALDQSLSLLDGLYPLDPEADPEYVKALREMARSQMSEIVKELGTVGLPSILRIDTYFDILLGQHPTRNFTHVQFDPDKIKGTLGKLRDTYGIKFRGNKFNNSIEDEQDITNFRMISDYMTSLLQSWIANREFFVVKPKQLAFFGTQLVLISRQLNVIAETVNEVRFTLDSVFIGPNERQSLLLEFTDESLPAMFLEDILVEIENFVTNEGPQLLRDGGKISVTNNILPVVRSLRNLVDQAHHPAPGSKVPDGYRTARVRHSLDDLQRQLGELIRLTEQVEQQVPPSEDQLAISGVSGAVSADQYSGYTVDLSFLGSGIDTRAGVVIKSPVQAAGQTVVFYSAQRIDVTFDPDQIPPGLENGDHEVTVTNPDGEFATLRFTYHWDREGGLTVAPSKGGNGGNGGNGNGGSGGGGGSGYAPSRAIRPARKTRSVVIETGGGEAAPAASVPAAATPAPAPVAPAPAAAAPVAPAPVPAATAPVAAAPVAPAPVPAAAAPAAAAPVAPVPVPAAAAPAVAPTQQQIAEMLKAHHPTLWKRIKDEF